MGGNMVTLLLMPIIGLFVAINILLGCYVAIRLGYGPPHWVYALNLVVRVTTFQNWLNAARTWLEEKIPRTEKLFTRLRVPKPIIIVDVTLPEEGSKEEEEETGEVNEESAEEMSETPEGEEPQDPVPGEESVA
jgi:hypothetical protein